MIIEKIIVKNFLSYGGAEVSPGPDINLITGPNTAGKTNLIDSIYLSAVGKGSSSRDDSEYVNWESDGDAEVIIAVKKRFSRHIIQTQISKKGAKRISIDGMPIQRIGELMGVLNVIFFDPDETSLIKGGPSERRRFLDISICQQSKTYFYTLQRYQKLLDQRNKVLKSYKNNPTQKDMIEIINQDFIKCAAFIVGERQKFVETITPFVVDSHNKLSIEKENIKLTYETEPIHGDIEEDLKKLMEETYQRDVELGYTNVGPHRDDLKISANDIDLRRFGSQGQKRTAVLSLKLASGDFIEVKTKEKPVYLLDDVMGELDKDRKRALLEALKGKQVFITDTGIPEGLPTTTKVFKIFNRKVQE